MAKSRLCSVQGCGKRHLARGVCSSHYYRLKQHGDPLAGSTEKGATLRFIREVALPYEGDDCLRWPYTTTVEGYGILRVNRKTLLASRIVCAEANGPSPAPYYEAAHSCGNGHLGCITKRHLSWKTPKENNADKLAHGTDSRGQKHGAAKLTEADVRAIRLATGLKTQRNLAEQFCVAIQTVSCVQRRISWAWLD